MAEEQDEIGLLEEVVESHSFGTTSSGTARELRQMKNAASNQRN